MSTSACTSDSEKSEQTQQSLTPADKSVTGYWSAWDEEGHVDPAGVPWTKLTHINVAFVGISADYKCKFWTDYQQSDMEDPQARANAQALIAYRNQQKYPTKIILSVGGWSLSYRISEALTAAKRTGFINSCVQLMKDMGADGLDLDWEYPGRLGPQGNQSGSCRAGWTCSRPSDDTNNLASFFTEVRAHADMSGKLLTAAVRANGYLNSTSAGDGSQYVLYPYSTMAQKLDMTHIMAYDLHGVFEPTTGHNADYNQVMNTMNFWKGQFTATYQSKLSLGLPLYGYLWTGAASSAVGSSAGSSWGGPYGNGQIPYKEVVANWSGAGCMNYTAANDRWKHCSGNVNGVSGAWITYDPELSLEAKISWWNTYSYRTMFWVMGQDSGSVLVDTIWNKTGNSTGTADTVRPTQPGSLTTSGITASTIRLNWTAATDNVGVTGYRLYKNGVDTGATTTNLYYDFTGLSASQSYTLGVAAYDAAGLYSLTSEKSETTSASGMSGGTTCPAFAQPVAGQPGYAAGDKVTYNGLGFQSVINGNIWSPALNDTRLWVTTTNCSSGDAMAPTTPTVTIGAVTASSIAISWSGATDNVGVTGYKLYKNGVYVSPDQTGSTYTFTGLQANTSYTLAVAAKDAAGNLSTPRSVSQITGGSPDGTAPTQPGSPTASAITTNSITLNWTASTDAGGNLAGYRVYKNGTFVQNVTSGTSFQFTNLTSGTSYRLGVKAYDTATNESALAELTQATSAGGTACPAFMQPFAGDSGYVYGAKVVFNGTNYMSTYSGANFWSPSAAPSYWQSGVTCP